MSHEIWRKCEQCQEWFDLRSDYSCPNCKQNKTVESMSNQKNKEQELKEASETLKKVEDTSTNLYWKVLRLRKGKKLVVSDHAIVRYLDRIESIPVGEVCSKLLSSDVINFYSTLGDGTYPIAKDSSIRVVIKDGVIVTVYK